MNRANSFFESILTGVRTAVVVIDRDLRVLAWNYRAEDMWGLRTEEVKGQNLLNLDIGLPVQELRPDVRACLPGERDHSEKLLSATNRRGRSTGVEKEIRGAILMMDENGAA